MGKEVAVQWPVVVAERLEVGEHGSSQAARRLVGVEQPPLSWLAEKQARR